MLIPHSTTATFSAEIVNFFPSKESCDQTKIRKDIGSLGTLLNNLPVDIDLNKDFKPIEDVVNRCITSITGATDRHHLSTAFDRDTTNEIENLILLMTVVDSSRLAKENKTTLLARLNAALRKCDDSKQFLHLIEKAEAKITGDSQSASIIEVSSLPPKITLRVGDQQFTVKSTTGGGTNDCLAYALQTEYSPLATDYRSGIFTAERIEAQLNRLIEGHETNALSNSSDDTTTKFELAKQIVEAAYRPQSTSSLIPDSITDISALSHFLPTYIQGDCYLDTIIAGGIFAATIKQPLVIVSRNNRGEQQHHVLNAEGFLINSGNDLSGVPKEIVEQAKFIYNKAGYHFERMEPADSGSI